MKITVDTLDEMTDIVNNLVRKGLGFDSYKKDGRWIIELTGGY